MSLEAMAEGARRIFILADQIDAVCSISGESRIKFVDIGGGLSANYKSDEITPTFSSYAKSLLQFCGKSILQNSRIVITEFGKSLITKCGVICTVVEDVILHARDNNGQSKITAVGHAGADILLRTAYCPDKFSHRVVLLNSEMEIISASENQKNIVSLVGPLCFSGDVIVSNVTDLPAPKIGDIGIILDSGANTLSLFSKHCSRLSPPVYAFRSVSVDYGSEISQSNSFVITKIREKEQYDSMLKFWD
jgi:diaminopimelate decarboxylase